MKSVTQQNTALDLLSNLMFITINYYQLYQKHKLEVYTAYPTSFAKYSHVMLLSLDGY